MWVFNRRIIIIRALINQTKSISVEKRGLTNLERERARERGVITADEPRTVIFPCQDLLPCTFTEFKILQNLCNILFSES